MSKTHEVTRALKRTVERWKLWRGGEALLVAVSGGIDSMVLLHAVSHLPPALRPKPTTLHFNHKLRSESEEEARFVQETSARWEIPAVVGESEPWTSRKNLQARARDLRYDFFRRASERLGVSKIATAHQADDQAETFLIRWIQGAGLKGLAGIPVSPPNPPLKLRGGQGGDMRVVRPLLFVSRTEILDYAKRFEVPYREDTSNQDPKYLRNRIRKVLPTLREMNQNLDRRTSVNSMLIRADEEFLEGETERALCRGASRCAPTDDVQFSVTVYLSLPPALRYRMLQRMFEGAAGEGHVLGGEHILKLDELLSDPTPEMKYSLPHGVSFKKDYVLFSLKK